MKSSSVASRSIWSRIWSKYATVCLLPWRTVPLSGASSPRMIFSKVVLPAPLGPIRPILSPRRMVAVKSRITVRCPPSAPGKDLLMRSSSATILPLALPLATSSFTLPRVLRRCSRWARSRSRRVIRPCARVRRASTPLRIHTSSCASSLSARALITASCASCSSLSNWYCAKLPG